ncbi:MAG TPA: hypothetical protein DEB40_12505 [Elusimicrobia bacterium]|nr:hypothetical protein [Elusimicrobiota bacterium]HBT62556.1 hypothetical protein [Elusimicrobiota bacterium]
MKFSIIISTCNEGFQVASSLKRLRQISTQGPLEIIVVDGRSEDDTVAQARPWADHVIVHERANRGEQFHLGAQKASGDLLLFLGADAQLPGNWQQTLEHFWLTPNLHGVCATAFTVDYGASLTLRLAAFLANASVRWRARAGIQHGLCTTAEIYRSSGGFPPLPCLEDLVFCSRLRPLGRMVVLPDHIWPSVRRLHRYGILGCVARHLWLELRFRLGASPDAICRGHIG